jgi:isoamylase
MRCEISQDPLNASNQNGTYLRVWFASYRAIDSGTYAPKGIVLASSLAKHGHKTNARAKGRCDL